MVIQMVIQRPKEIVMVIPRVTPTLMEMEIYLGFHLLTGWGWG